MTLNDLISESLRRQMVASPKKVKRCNNHCGTVLNPTLLVSVDKAHKTHRLFSVFFFASHISQTEYQPQKYSYNPKECKKRLNIELLTSLDCNFRQRDKERKKIIEFRQKSVSSPDILHEVYSSHVCHFGRCGTSWALSKRYRIFPCVTSSLSQNDRKHGSA